MESKSTPLDAFLEDSERSQEAIVLVDATYSMFQPFGQKSRWDKAREICDQLPFQNMRMLFWNTANHLAFFSGGVHVVPPKVRAGATMQHVFSRVAPKIDPQCVTCTYVAFEGIPSEWKTLPPTEVILITDGTMGWASISPDDMRELSRKLAQAIRDLPSHYRLSILTVEDDAHALQGESATFTGSDVYRVIKSEKLTSRVREFTSYVPNGEPVTHLSRAFVSPGYVPFGRQQFSQLRTQQFFHLLAQSVGETEEEQLVTIQKLTGTLAHLFQHQGKVVADSLIKKLVPLFTLMEANMVRYLLTMGVEDEQNGTAGLIQGYRARLKKLYRDAQTQLHQNVSVAVNVDQTAVSFPVQGHVVVCSAALVTETFEGKNRERFPYGAIQGGVPVMPLLATHEVPLMNAQCLRQYSRAVLSKLYGGDGRHDLMLYLALALNYVVGAQPDLPAEVRHSFRSWCKIMWHKKRLRSDQTEIALLQAGHIPVPNNGTVDKFHTYVRNAAAKVGLTGSVMRLWEQWMLALDPAIGAVQKSLCTQDPLYGTLPLEPAPRWKFVELKDDRLGLDYTCYITMDPLEKQGGFRIPEHKGFSGLCSPKFLMSASGKEQLASRGASFQCPLCYSEISVSELLPVEPRPEFDIGVSLHSSAVGHSRSVCPDRPNAPQGSVVYILRGTVGGGKSTFARHLASLAAERKMPCLILNTDQYARQGIPMAQAVEQVQLDLREFLGTHQDEAMVVICDTCNERFSRKSPVFGQQLRGFRRRVLMPNVDKTNLEGYAKWSLRNVLQRGSTNSSADQGFWLNPVDASVGVCKRVHAKKFNAIWGKKPLSAIPCNATAQSLEDEAQAYQSTLPKLPTSLP